MMAEVKLPLHNHRSIANVIMDCPRMGRFSRFRRWALSKLLPSEFFHTPDHMLFGFQKGDIIGGISIAFGSPLSTDREPMRAGIGKLWPYDDMSINDDGIGLELSGKVDT